MSVIFYFIILKTAIVTVKTKELNFV